MKKIVQGEAKETAGHTFSHVRWLQISTDASAIVCSSWVETAVWPTLEDDR